MPPGQNRARPIKPSHFSCLQGWGGAQRPRCQKSRLTSTNSNETLHESLWTWKHSWCKIESSSSSSFWDICHKISLGKGSRSSNSAIYPLENGLSFLKKSFYVQNHFPWSKIDLPPPNVNFSNFQVEEFFSFCKFWDFLMRKEQQQPPRLINFAKIWSEHVFKINTESHNIWASYVE